MGKKKIQSFVWRAFGGMCFWFLALPSLTAQSPVNGRIYYAEGADISITIGGVRYSYEAENLRFFSLRKEDLVQTGPRSFVEIRFEPSGLLVKIAENSSFAFDGTGEAGGLLLSLLYGRIRVISGWNEQPAPAVVRLGSTVVDIVEGDIGLDYMVIPGEGSRPIPRVSGFSGTAELIPQARPAPGGRANRTWSGYVSDLPVIRLEEHESITMGTKTICRSLEPEILSYWNQHNFMGHPPIPAPAPVPERIVDTAPPAPDFSVSNIFPQGSRKKESNLQAFQAPALSSAAGQSFDENPFLPINRVKETALMVGTIFTATGIALEGIGYWMTHNDQASLGDTIMLYGFIPAGLGLISLIISLAINPPPP
jgi:hypothetical protein